MDERAFDDLVKKKLQGYEDPGDDYAFNELKDRLKTRQPVISSNKLVYASTVLMLALTALNIALIFHPFENEDSPIVGTRVDSLINVINKLQTESDLLQEQLTCIQQEGRSGPRPAPIHVANLKEPAEPVTITSEPTKTSQRMIFLHRNDSGLTSFSPPVTMPAAKFIFIEKPTEKKSRRQAEISAKIKNNLERHYFTGLGINVAPQITLGTFMMNSSALAPAAGFGLGVDWIVSPNLSVETSVRYSALTYKIPKDDPVYQSSDDKYYGGPIEVRQNYNAITASALLNYRQWITQRDQVNFKIGLSRYEGLFGKHIIKYQQPGYADPDDRGSITQIRKMDGLRNLGNVLSLNAGVSRQIDKNHKIEFTAFYDYGLGGNDLKNFGIRTSLWFRAR